MVLEQEDDLVQGTEIDRIKCFIQLLEDTNQSLSMTIENKEKALQEWEKYRIDIINDVSTFSKNFKSYVGVTPGQYRKEFKNKR